MWVALTGIALAGALALAPGIASDRWIYFGLALLAIQWIAFITLGMLFLLRRPLGRTRPLQVAYLAVMLLLLNTWVVGTLGWLLMQGISPMTEPGLPFLLLRLTGIALAVSVLGLAAFRNHWRARQSAVRAKQSELEALQARIRPHFLFNTLNTAAALVHQRPGEAERLLLDLADLFRAALGGPREIPLEEELALTRRYVEIESLRFSDRLVVRWCVPATVPATMVPALSIQPLVENAIRHGVEISAGPTVVEIEVEQEGETVRITVRNDLPAGSQLPHQGHQLGQASTRARIEALTGGRGRLDITTLDGRYVATVTLPQTSPPD